MGEHAECTFTTVSLPTPTPSLCPAPPTTLATHTCATPMPCAQVEVAGTDAQAEVGAWVGCKGEGAPHPLLLGLCAVSLTLPCPPWLHCLAPSPFPNLLGLRVTIRLDFIFTTQIHWTAPFSFSFLPYPEAHVQYDLAILTCTIGSLDLS